MPVLNSPRPIDECLLPLSKFRAVNSAVLSSGAACRTASSSVSRTSAASKRISCKSGLFHYSNRLKDGLRQDEVGVIEIEAWRFACLDEPWSSG